MSVKSNILTLFKQTKELSIKEVTDKLQVSKQMVHLAMNQLLSENVVEKLGRTPKTVYRFINEKNRLKEPSPDLY
ncbi:MAG TPA: hypothetical protein DIT07_10485, partial [Sphingobacteriaceae bacterium]|nr:hypothetical protein [Sphingobacteriaceae bacterium]